MNACGNLLSLSQGQWKKEAKHFLTPKMWDGLTYFVVYCFARAYTIAHATIRHSWDVWGVMRTHENPE